MAASTARDVRVEQLLGALQAYVEDFPALAQEWDTLVEADRVATSLQWDHLIADYLPELDERFRAGAMSDANAVRYRCLLDQLKDILPLVHQLGFSPPPLTPDP